ncbi:MAG: hypothetical protein JWL81_1635 [Verrucomicrobiales bacterium]|nr:hypothetical protein [Verrucomicrobiales bacterium]
MKIRFSPLSALLVMLSAASLPAATVFMDFGDSSQVTAGNYNNFTKGAVSVLSIADLVDSTGSATGISGSVSGFHAGSNTSGATAPTGAAALFDAQATRDNFFGSTGIFGTVTAPTGTVTFSGLDGSGATAYTFDFFASRTGVVDNREAEYSIAGIGAPVSVFLDASNNLSNTTSSTGIVPTLGGTITITVDPGPANTNTTGFFYLGAIRMTSVPEPAGASLAALAGLTLLGQRRRKA